MKYVYFVDKIYAMYLPSKIKFCVNVISIACTIHNKRVKGIIVQIRGFTYILNKIQSIFTRNSTHVTKLIKLF